MRDSGYWDEGPFTSLEYDTSWLSAPRREGWLRSPSWLSDQRLRRSAVGRRAVTLHSMQPAARSYSEGATRAIFTVAALATMLGAALGFAVQPLISRQLLPRLGGSAAVWNTTLVFFQAGLLLGYLVTHLTTKVLRPGVQAAVHLGVLVVGLAVLPIGVPASRSPPTYGSPVWWQLGVLALTVGPAYFAVATASPLAQRWVSLSAHHRAPDPYLLYAVSNVGSFIGLLVVPLWLDRSFSLVGQSRLWAIAYCAFLASCVALVAIARPHRQLAPLPSDPAPETAETRPGLGRLARWAVLAFVPSSLILGVTTHITTDLASVPLLWVVPLALYLLTHIVAFSEHAPPGPVRDVLAAAAVAVTVTSLFVDYRVFRWTIVPHFAALFFVGLACHGRLADERPPAEHLTAFYLALSVGGLAGGLFNAIVAPVVFDMVIEYPMILVVSLVLLGASRDHLRTRAAPLAARAAAATAVGVAVVGVTVVAVRSIETHPGRVLLLVTVVTVTATAVGRSLLAAVVVGTVAVLAVRDLGAGAVHFERGFYGAIRIEQEGGFRKLVHGTTVHGYQFLDKNRRDLVTSYYGSPGPLSQAVTALRARDGRLGRVGVVGLGIGTIAGYLDPGDAATFYEIDPIVVRLARDRSLFTYLSESTAPVRIVVGDGRRELARTDERYDLLVIDAFSSDAIPVHLLTVEAVRTYQRRLTAGGILAIHISNRYLDLEPVVAAIARETRLHARTGRFNVSDADARAGVDSSDWVVLARDRTLLGRLSTAIWSKAETRRGVRAWTDDRADLLDVLIGWAAE